MAKVQRSTILIKATALDVPFLLLPFRPSSDPSAARTFIRNFFLPPQDREPLRGSLLENELRMTEVMVWVGSDKRDSTCAYGNLGLDQCYEMVLGSSTWRRRYVGSL